MVSQIGAVVELGTVFKTLVSRACKRCGASVETGEIVAIAVRGAVEVSRMRRERELEGREEVESVKGIRGLGTGLSSESWPEITIEDWG